VVEVDHEAGDEVISLRQNSHKKAKKGAAKTEGASCRAGAVVDWRSGNEGVGERLVLHVVVSILDCEVTVLVSLLDCDVKKLESFMPAAVEK
jgi:hypothetical protein